MESVQWKVEGMTCANCALTIRKYLENQGQQNIKVNPIDGEVSFELVEGVSTESLKKGIHDLGYLVAGKGESTENIARPWLYNHFRRFLFCLPFTAILMLHMLHNWLQWHWLMNPWIQLALCLPVYIVGMQFFGKSAVKSLRNGMPNMNVLVALGATSAFIYSLVGSLLDLGPDYLFNETAATIITLVFLGNHMEDASVASTQKALQKLASSQKVMANMIAFDDQHQEVVFPIENTQLKVGDLLLIKTGEQIPIDCRILSGEGEVSEALLTGESIPVRKQPKDTLIGGSLMENGVVKAMVTATGDDTVLSNILRMVRQAQGEKPPVQLLADKISAIFVPVVIGLAVLTLAGNWIFLGDFTQALMRSIAVLVISCPCAMGLATPAAIAVGLGRGARNGILYRNATSLENFRNIRQVVFDKTGTLTTGKFRIASFQILDKNLTEESFKQLVFSLEKYSNHPIARSVSAQWKMKQDIRWKNVEEIKGRGMKAVDAAGDVYTAGSYQTTHTQLTETRHSVYVSKNDVLIGVIDLEDELREEVPQMIRSLKANGIRTVLLSGDHQERCQKMAAELGIDEVFAEQSPAQKLEKIETLNKKIPTAMVGDGINDAPALAKATIGISLSEASEIAMQSAHVVLMQHGLRKLPEALGLGKHTYLTIKQNLFWAFFYNIIAIPIAAFGFLVPGMAALAMGLSDVVLAANSLRLYVKKIT